MVSGERYNFVMQNADPVLLRQLSGNSGPYRDPLATIGWSRLDVTEFWLPDPALSLYGLPEYDTLAVDVRQRLRSMNSST